mmetsp:Transcript_19272/g.28531  ORF Transcript_19272/g.28531 Transcript_19272/m.28531 type:complete len:204 (-) Transcript_19272:15-626(-)
MNLESNVLSVLLPPGEPGGLFGLGFTLSTDLLSAAGVSTAVPEFSLAGVCFFFFVSRSNSPFLEDPRLSSSSIPVSKSSKKSETKCRSASRSNFSKCRCSSSVSRMIRFFFPRFSFFFFFFFDFRCLLDSLLESSAVIVSVLSSKTNSSTSSFHVTPPLFRLETLLSADFDVLKTGIALLTGVGVESVSAVMLSSRTSKPLES